MSNLAEWLERDFDVLVEAAVEAMGSTPEARETARPAVEAFYTSLAETSKKRDPTSLNRVLNAWVEARSGPTEEETARFVPALLALKSVTVGLAAERNAPANAVSLLVLLNQIMDDAVAFLDEQEIGAALRDVRRELDNAQAVQRMLDQSKSDFISVAAHELKTPLTLIEGYANMLREEFPPDQYPRVGVMLGGISNGTMRLREIIDDMIDVSLIDMRIMELHLQPVWLNRLVDIVVAEVGPVAAARQIALGVEDFEDQSRPVLGDPERLHQVFRNIIVNAIKFTPDGGTVTVRARSLPDFFDVQVADTGIGIAADDLDRIFEKFAALGDAALHSSSKTNFKGGGPGLGLAIAKGIIEAHGGNIWAESPGCDEELCPGSTFHIMVPVRSDSSPDAGSRTVTLEQLVDADADDPV